jgi:hypothetical protein
MAIFVEPDVRGIVKVRDQGREEGRLLPVDEQGRIRVLRDIPVQGGQE